MPATIGSVRIGLRTVSLYAFTGVVTSSMKDAEPFRDPDTGEVTDLRTRISTKVNLVGPDDESRWVDISATGISVRAGDRVTLVWARVGSNESDDAYVAVHDHDTAETGWWSKGVNDAAGPPLYNGVLIVIVFVVVANFMGTLRADPASWPPVVLSLGIFAYILLRRRTLRAAVRSALAAIASAPARWQQA